MKLMTTTYQKRIYGRQQQQQQQRRQPFNRLQRPRVRLVLNQADRAEQRREARNVQLEYFRNGGDMLLGFSGEQVRDVGRVLDEERA